LAAGEPGEAYREGRSRTNGARKEWLMATFHDEQMRTGWSRTRWIVLAAIALAIVVAVVLVLVYSGGGGSSGGGGGY
jgi:UDP-N-acetylmuramyl pentapeptide phosphotransferase/UDP-N-acetylglucosamine-1-phosphate transferase